MKQEIKDRIEKIRNGEVPGGYRKSDLGVIPREWKLDIFDNIGKWIGGYAFKSSDFLNENLNNNCFQVLKMGNVKMGFIDESTNPAFIEKHSVGEKQKDYILNLSDILISLTGTINKTDYGNVAVVEDENKYLLNQRVGCLRTNSTNRRKYYYYFMQSEIFRKMFFLLGLGGTGNQANVGIMDIKSMIVINPPLPEQQKIASILSTWDKAIDLKEELVEEKKKQKKGLMQKLLTGEVRLLGFDGEWKEVALGEIADMNSGGTPNSTYPEYYDGDIPWVSISDMTKNGKYIYSTERNISELGLNNSSAKLYPIDTVLFAMYASIGECSISKVELSSSQAILGIRPGKILNNEYLYYYLTSIKEKLKLQGQQGTQSNLNAGMIKELRLLLPEINEQLAIVNILTTADKEITLLEQELEALKLQKKGLMQLLLTGIVRVNTEN